MTRIRHLSFMLLLAAVWLMHSGVLFSQDAMPDVASPQLPLFSVAESPESFMLSEPIKLVSGGPEGFSGCGPNVIYDDSCSLFPFMKKLNSLRTGMQSSPVRIVHIGDSHVRGYIFPGEVKRLLERDFGSAAAPAKLAYNSSGIAQETGGAGIVYHIMAVNGSTAQNFCDPVKVDKVAALKPDLIVISFGTNESMGRYDKDVHKNQLDMLLRMLRERCPSASFLLTTPPGCFSKSRRSVPNAKVASVASSIRAYAAEKGVACWDLYDVAGGKDKAYTNWYRNKLMQRDRIHFTGEGYLVMGRLMHAALIDYFNRYVSK